MHSMKVGGQTGKRVKTETVQSQKEGGSKTIKGGMLPRSDRANVLYPVGGGDLGDPQTRAVRIMLECECPRCGGSWWRWNSGDHRSSRQWMSWVPHIGHR